MGLSPPAPLFLLDGETGPAADALRTGLLLSEKRFSESALPDHALQCAERNFIVRTMHRDGHEPHLVGVLTPIDAVTPRSVSVEHEFVRFDNGNKFCERAA
jgi:hypothetical protein